MFSLLLPLLGIVIFGSLFGWWLSARVRYQIFEYRTLWLTAHKSKEWRDEIKPRAVWRDGFRCIYCNTRKRLEGHYRKYIGYLGRQCGWRETGTFCKDCHACFDGHEWLEAIEAREKGLRPIPFSTVFPGYSRWTTLRVLWRDKRRCRGCRSKLGIRFHRRAKKPARWNLWGRFLQWKNVYLLCGTCLRKLELKRGRVQPPPLHLNRTRRSARGATPQPPAIREQRLGESLLEHLQCYSAFKAAAPPATGIGKSNYRTQSLGHPSPHSIYCSNLVVHYTQVAGLRFVHWSCI